MDVPKDYAPTRVPFARALLDAGHDVVFACAASFQAEVEAAGVPMVIIPVQGDQPRNAGRCAELGVGRVIAPKERNPQAIQAAVCAVLTEPAYRRNAVKLRDEVTALPGMDHATMLLEQLAAERTPIPA